MTTSAETLAAEAATNGAEPVAKAATLTVSKLIAVSSDLGIGFFGVAITGAGASIAAQSFKHAWKVARG